MLSRAIYRKQRGRRPLAALATLSVIMGLLLSSGTVLAVHDEHFQLDGDVTASTTTNVGGVQTIDWSSIFTSAGAPVASLPTGFKDAGFKADFKTNTNGTFSTSDNSTYATGSKDTQPISGWQCNQDNNVSSKVDVMNAYVVSYTNTAGDQIQYFALERNTNTGTADVGFWFLQAPVGCESTGSAVTFTGQHLDGDVLVVSEFSNGGTVSTINVYRWDRPGNPVGVPGSLRTTPIGSGVDCRDPLLAGGDPACGAANRVTNGAGGTIMTPWLTSNFKDNVGNSLRTSEFYEGGINLTDLGLGGKCFNTFIGDTRSSTSLTATLFDFSSGTSGSCTSGITTTPQTGDGTGTIPATIGTAARVPVRDHAVITVGGTSGSFGGTVKFYLCGPLALTSTTNCSIGGVQIGTPLTGETVTGTAGTASLNSDPVTLTSAGRYCWRAEYSGDSGVGVPASSDPAKSVADGGTTSECFSIGPVQPVLTTSAGADVILGTSITDTASLAGTAMQPGTDGVGPGGTIGATAATQAAAGGTITFVVDTGSCAASGLTVTGSPVTVSGDNTSYGPVSATPTAVGTYIFVATYDGNSPNTSGAAGSCPVGANDGDETVVVTGTASIASAQRWLPNDRVTVTGDTALTGTLTVTLYPSINCTGTAVPNQAYTFNLSATPSGTPFNTTNSTFFVGTKSDGAAGAAAGSYSWLVHYDDNTLTDPADHCETSTLSPITD